MTVRLAIDSVGQLPAELADAWGVAVVPVSIIVDGREHAETDLDPDEFLATLAEGAEVSTSLPAPGAFLAAWQRLVDDGATEILSFHVSSELSGTWNSARLAAESAPVPVTVVDTGQISFGVSCALWSARLVLAEGGTADEAVAAAAVTAKDLANVFVMDGMELARRSGRLSGPVPDAPSQGVDVYSFVDGALEVDASVPDLDGAASAMVAAITRSACPVRAAVGHGHDGLAPLSDALVGQLEAAPDVVEVLRYRVGPSVAAFSGPGSAGAYWFPA
ncbi:MAG: DegV family protein [Actinomycetota bacterium]